MEVESGKAGVVVRAGLVSSLCLCFASTEVDLGEMGKGLGELGMCVEVRKVEGVWCMDSGGRGLVVGECLWGREVENGMCDVGMAEGRMSRCNGIVFLMCLSVCSLRVVSSLAVELVQVKGRCTD